MEKKMEKIKSIKETTFKPKGSEWTDYEGYEIVTSKQTILLGIQGGQSCCEQYGYFMTEDNLNDFVGANLRNVVLTDKGLNKVAQDQANDIYDGGIMFVNLETSRGTLQFVAYNSHNGYYGHDACVVSTQLNHSECL
jgi:hypothetical protein